MEPIVSQVGDPKKIAKLLAIPILAIALAFMVFSGNDGDADTGDGVVSLNPEAVEGADLTSYLAKSRAGTDVTDAKPAGPSFDVEQVLLSNPFVLPLPLRIAKQAAEESEATEREAGSELPEKENDGDGEVSPLRALTDELEQKSASIITSTPQGWVASIDSRVVGVGDYLQEGVRVVEIGPNGVTVEIEAED
ncbi:MAG: hypothetical protein H8E44_05455 [Planctomycetes bacterium]|nr:hypothetical protein [Planctomycetota bacterium]MBL7043066.1 hypothetical protein [Pirellulaceae bacterium]